MNKSEDDGKVACPRCGQRMLKIKDRFPAHTKVVYNATAPGGKAEICQ